MFDSVSDFGIGDVWDMPLCDFSFSGLAGWVRCIARWIVGIEKLSVVYAGLACFLYEGLACLFVSV